MSRPRDPERRKRVSRAPEARHSAWHNEAGYAQPRWRRRRGESHLEAVLQRLRCHGGGAEQQGA